MKHLAIIILIINCCFAQEKKNEHKGIFIEKIISILNPYNGRADDLDLSYSYELYKKYGIKSFEFHKINALDGSDCNFTYANGNDILPQSLNIGDFYSHDIYNDEKTIYVRAKYNRYIRYEKNPIASQAEVILYVYKVKK